MRKRPVRSNTAAWRRYTGRGEQEEEGRGGWERLGGAETAKMAAAVIKTQQWIPLSNAATVYAI